jgi:hypothetical protein
MLHYLIKSSFRLVTLGSFTASAWMYFLGNSTMLWPAVFWFLLYLVGRTIEFGKEK